MKEIKEYKNSKGETRYKFRVYAGYVLGKSRYVNRSGFKKKSEAIKAYREVKFNAYQGEYIKDKEALKLNIDSFSDLANLFFDQYIAGVKYSTYSANLSLYRSHIANHIGEKKLFDVRPIDCQFMINSWIRQGLSRSTMRKIKGLVNRIFEFANDLQIMDFNPIARVKLPQVNNNSETEFYNKDELTLYLDVVKEYSDIKHFTIMRLLAYSGMRIGELLALRWSSILFNKSKILIDKTLTKAPNKQGIRGTSINLSTPKTYTSKRVINIDKETLDILRKWQIEQKRQLLQKGLIKELTEDSLIFSNNLAPILSTSLNKWNNRFCDKYNLREITLHGFRHTHATLLFAAGVNIKEVQKRLGHAKVEMTLDIYTHYLRNADESVGETFADYMKNVN